MTKVHAKSFIIVACVCPLPLHHLFRTFLFVSLFPYYVVFFLAFILLYFELHCSFMIHYSFYGAHCNMLPCFAIVFMAFIVINNRCFNVSIRVPCCSLWILYVLTKSYYGFFYLSLCLFMNLICVCNFFLLFLYIFDIHFAWVFLCSLFF
jgi:hypothetical protein